MVSKLKAVVAGSVAIVTVIGTAPLPAMAQRNPPPPRNTYVPPPPPPPPPIKPQFNNAARSSNGGYGDRNTSGSSSSFASRNNSAGGYGGTNAPTKPGGPGNAYGAKPGGAGANYDSGKYSSSAGAGGATKPAASFASATGTGPGGRPPSSAGSLGESGAASSRRPDTPSSATAKPGNPWTGVARKDDPPNPWAGMVKKDYPPNPPATAKLATTQPVGQGGSGGLKGVFGETSARKDAALPQAVQATAVAASPAKLRPEPKVGDKSSGINKAFNQAAQDTPRPPSGDGGKTKSGGRSTIGELSRAGGPIIVNNGDELSRATRNVKRQIEQSKGSPTAPTAAASKPGPNGPKPMAAGPKR